MNQDTQRSPNWGTLMKASVALSGLLLAGGLLLRFHSVIPLLVLALILAFLLVPVVRVLDLRLRIPWAIAANVCFLLLLLILIGISTATGVAMVQQLQALYLTVQRFLLSLPTLLESISEQTYVFGPWVFDLSQFDLATLAEQLLAAIQPLLGQVSSLIANLATGAIESLASIIFTLAIAYFLVLDYRRIRGVVLDLAIPGYTEDFQRLRVALIRIWNAFLRGQLLVVTSTGILTWTLMTLLGLRFSLGLGVLGGIAKFVPILGPVTAGLVAALVALFQPDNWLGLTPIAHALLVVLSVTVLDQLIDYLIVPRIMGASLNLHPVLILLGLFLFASLAGVLGLLLSAPMMASIILLGRYTYRKMFDLSPWDPPIDTMRGAERRPNRVMRALVDLVTRMRARIEGTTRSQTASGSHGGTHPDDGEHS